MGQSAAQPASSAPVVPSAGEKIPPAQEVCELQPTLHRQMCDTVNKRLHNVFIVIKTTDATVIFKVWLSGFLFLPLVKLGFQNCVIRIY